MITPCSFFPFGITYHCPATAFSHRETLPSAAPPPLCFFGCLWYSMRDDSRTVRLRPACRSVDKPIEIVSGGPLRMKEILLTLVTAVAAYLLGCISTGTIVSRREGVNIRNEGSHNTGASNVLRVLGLKDGLITFLGDFAKAALACLIGNLLVPSAFGIEGLGRIVAALFVAILRTGVSRREGGKGVACSTAVVLLIHPLCGLPSILLCVLVIAVTKYISLGSMTMLLTYMVLIWIVCFGQWALCIFATLLFIMCVYRHRANIQRLLNGTENKIGRRVQPQNTEKK